MSLFQLSIAKMSTSTSDLEMRNEKNREGDKKDSSSQLMIVALLTANVNQLINAYEYDNLEGKKKTLRTVVMGLLSVSLSLQVNFDYYLTLIIKLPKFQKISLFQSTLKTNAQILKFLYLH